MQKLNIIGTLSLALASCSIASAQDHNTKADIEKALLSNFTLTKTTADMTDIITPGCVLVLRKDNLVTFPITTRSFYHNTYKNGRISQGALGALAKMSERTADGAKVGTRTFVSGEKLWVTNVAVTPKDIVFDLVSDPYVDVRYKASLAFPFPKDSTPSVAQVQQTVAEVFTVQPFDNANAQPPSPSQPPASHPGSPVAVSTQQPESAPPPIAPPPPPADAPQAPPATISLGQSPDEVTAILGKPDKIVKFATKQIYSYKDLKVTFVGGKVSDVQ